MSAWHYTSSTWETTVRNILFILFLLYIYFLIIISLIFSMFFKGYQREKHKDNREEIENVTAQKLQQKTLSWIHGSMDGWRPQDSSPRFGALQGRKLRCPPDTFVVIFITGLPV